jgi:hypothetical protein
MIVSPGEENVAFHRKLSGQDHRAESMARWKVG